MDLMAVRRMVIAQMAQSGTGGLEYEEGIWEPAEDIARGVISFSKTHSEMPAFFSVEDCSGTYDASTYTNYVCGYIDTYRISGTFFPTAASTAKYGVATYIYRTTNSSASTSGTTMTYNRDNTGSSSSAYARYWCDEGHLYPSSTSTSRYWRSGRKYKWFAVWGPSR